MRRAVVAIVGVTLALLLVAELVAVPVATRLAGSAVARCVSHEELRVERLRRPVVPRLLAGHADDVELVITGVEVEGLRIARVDAHVPRVFLPWRAGAARAEPTTLVLTILEEDLEALLAARAPLGLRPSLHLEEGSAELGLPPFTAAIPIEIALDGDVVSIAPAFGRPSWWARLGLAELYEVPTRVQVEALDLERDRLVARIVVEAGTGADGDSGCELLGVAAAEAAAVGAVSPRLLTSRPRPGDGPLRPYGRRWPGSDDESVASWRGRWRQW